MNQLILLEQTLMISNNFGYGKLSSSNYANYKNEIASNNCNALIDIFEDTIILLEEPIIMEDSTFLL